MAFRFSLPALLCCGALAAFGLTACNKPEAPPASEAAEANADSRLAAIDDSLARMNYGEAARLAAEAQAQYPGDHRMHAAAARTQARLGDADASAAALQRAVAAGLPDVAALLADPALAAVREHKAFAAYRPRTAAKAPAAATSRIRAGDVEIIESADGDVIRAGDVVLDTRP
jgi:hypothetical protein